MSKTLSDFIAFESLSVHDIRLTPQRVQATYTLVKKSGEQLHNELIYSYNKAVFDPKDWSSHNLAAQMVAQLAMNYGLFCEHLHFVGCYTATDQRFIRDMVENTSREIYVHKLLQPTEFLLEEYSNILPEHPEKFTAAQVHFLPDPLAPAPPKEKASIVTPDYTKFAVLSSGGKDSLLSYGMLNEFGEAHSIFINESGRHWYTAYNAYHELATHDTNTARVWCNSDRLFNWMVRQMPFIKANFQHIRSDQYPIRLWTVSVFLWGVLPLARKRGIGNIIIGNEYDTSLRLQHEGITHYAGLYDQSRYFDNAYSRYYRRKGWRLHQYSLLRPLSELLILKILVKRYPELQAQQVSCHASHKEGDRMKPCGKCEKCRRIVGMLTALEENPQRCGYTPAQITDCLSALSRKKVKQLGMDAEHLYYLLQQKGQLPMSKDNPVQARAHPAIMGLRFDEERSRLVDLPPYIRRPLLDIFHQYATGTYRRQGRRWETVELTPVELDAPYILDAPRSTTAPSKRPS